MVHSQSALRCVPALLLLSAAGCDLPAGPAAVPGTPPASGSPAAPAAPTGVTATSVSDTEIGVAWTDASADEDGFQIDRRMHVGGVWGAWAALPALPANATSHADAGLVPATRYQYRLRACNSVGCSAFAVAPAVATGYAPGAPGSLAGEGLPHEVALVWAAAAGNPTRYELQRGVRDGTWSAWSGIATLAGNVTGHTDTGVTEWFLYRYRIRACNAAGCSAYVVSSPIAAVYGPEAPLNSQLRVRSSSHIDMYWEASSDANNSFRLQRSVRAGDVWGPWELIAVPGGNEVAFSDTGLVGGTRYRYRIRQCNLAGCSAYDLTVAATTPPG